MILINNKNNLLELVGTIFIPPYGLSVPKDKVTERKIEPPTRELMYLELPM